MGGGHPSFCPERDTPYLAQSWWPSQSGIPVRTYDILYIYKFFEFILRFWIKGLPLPLEFLLQVRPSSPFCKKTKIYDEFLPFAFYETESSFTPTQHCNSSPGLLGNVIFLETFFILFLTVGFISLYLIRPLRTTRDLPHPLQNEKNSFQHT